MFKDVTAFSGFSVDDMAAAKKFYGETLGIEIEESDMGLTLKTAGPAGVFVYQKDTHQPATFTVLNFVVDDIDSAVDELGSKGVLMEHIDMAGGATADEKGIIRGKAANMGPDIAWFKDPAGNVLSVLSN